jgi:hypothetical protein
MESSIAEFLIRQLAFELLPITCFVYLWWTLTTSCFQAWGTRGHNGWESMVESLMAIFCIVGCLGCWV